MAYPTVDKPFGLRPINLIGGQVFAGATRLMEIATTANVGLATNIFLWRFGQACCQWND
jgi:hypothetical protein